MFIKVMADLVRYLSSEQITLLKESTSNKDKPSSPPQELDTCLTYFSCSTSTMAPPWSRTGDDTWLFKTRQPTTNARQATRRRINPSTITWVMLDTSHGAKQSLLHMHGIRPDTRSTKTDEIVQSRHHRAETRSRPRVPHKAWRSYKPL
jgi:hypothetical protein